MKKLIRRVIIIVLLLVIVAVLAVVFFLDGIVKKGIETVGPTVTKVPVTVDSVHVSILGGSGSVKGLVVGNPDGFQTPHSISIGSASLALKIGSVLSDKVIIKSIELKQPEIYFEQTLHGNNLLSLLDNVNGSGTTQSSSTPAAAPTTPAMAKAEKKLEVDDFLISGAKLYVSAQGMSGSAIPVPIPDIHLTNLGTSGDGITAGELIKQVLTAIEQEAAQAGGNAIKNAGKELISNEASNVVGNAKSKISDGIGNLFNKK